MQPDTRSLNCGKIAPQLVSGVSQAINRENHPMRETTCPRIRKQKSHKLKMKN
jgi:hypothetical protein